MKNVSCSIQQHRLFDVLVVENWIYCWVRPRASHITSIKEFLKVFTCVCFLSWLKPEPQPGRLEECALIQNETKTHLQWSGVGGAHLFVALKARILFHQSHWNRLVMENCPFGMLPTPRCSVLLVVSSVKNYWIKEIKGTVKWQTTILHRMSF